MGGKRRRGEETGGRKGRGGCVVAVGEMDTHVPSFNFRQ